MGVAEALDRCAARWMHSGKVAKLKMLPYIPLTAALARARRLLQQLGPTLQNLVQCLAEESCGVMRHMCDVTDMSRQSRPSEPPASVQWVAS